MHNAGRSLLFKLKSNDDVPPTQLLLLKRCIEYQKGILEVTMPACSFSFIVYTMVQVCSNQEFFSSGGEVQVAKPVYEYPSSQLRAQLDLL